MAARIIIYNIRICIAGKEQPDGSWKLENGTAMSYFNWYPGQPGSATEPCIIIKATTLGDMLMDRSCSASSLYGCSFVCEY